MNSLNETDFSAPLKGPDSDITHLNSLFTEELFNDVDFLYVFAIYCVEYLPPLQLHQNCNSNATMDSDSNNNIMNCHSGVVNLSDHVLTDGEFSLLQKGLTFVCTPGAPTPASYLKI